MAELHKPLPNSLQDFRLPGGDRYYVGGQFNSTALTTVTPTLNAIYFTPFSVAKPTPLDRIAFSVATLSGTAGAVARAGIYEANSNMVPYTLIADGGEFNVSTTGGSTGIKTATINVDLQANTLYYLAFICGTGTPVIKAVPLAGQYPFYGTDGAFANSVGTYLILASTYGALPNPFPSNPSIAGSGNPYPAIAVRIG